MVAAMLVSSAQAQVQVGQNTTLNLTGDLGFGYNGDYGNLIGSSHATSLNGDANLNGSYYNPRFLSFYVDPIYNRSQANSGTGSLTNATSVTAGANLFGGSHFPGSISFGEAFNNSGNYGFGTTPGFTTTGKSHTFGLGWAELLPGLPPLTAQFSQTTSSSTIFGTDAEDHSSSKNLSLFSNYKLDGWYLGARFTDSWVHTELPNLITEDGSLTGDNNSKIVVLNASHKLPLKGSLGANYTWSDFSGDNDGTTISGSNQTVSGTASFTPTTRFSTSFQANYNSSLSGSVEQQLVSAGAVSPQVNLGLNSYSIGLNNFDNLMLTKSLSAGFSVGHEQQEIYGRTVTATHFSGILNYRFLKPLWGSLVLYAGANDQMTETGNQGAGLVAGANFGKQWSNLDIGASFAYAQDVQTVLATQVTSSYNYTANAERRIARRWRWLANFSGFHTGLGELTGSSAHAESYTTNISYKMYNLGASYARTNGTALVTANGLVSPAGEITPLLTGNQILLDTGSSYSFSTTMNPTRKLVTSFSYTRSISDSTGSQYLNFSNSKLLNVFTEYQFRKMTFTAGYTNLKQFVSSSGLPAGSYSNFYVGLQRWFHPF